MTQLSRFNERVKNLIQSEEAWRKTWKHSNPCDEWIQQVRLFGEGHCRHYIKARNDHFRNEMRSILDTRTWNGNVYLWLYIPNM